MLRVKVAAVLIYVVSSAAFSLKTGVKKELRQKSILLQPHRFDKGIDRLHGMCCGYFAAYYLLAAEIAVLVWRCLRTGCGRAFFAVILSANLLKHIRPFESWKLADIREWP